jgi:hypothetical protein
MKKFFAYTFTGLMLIFAPGQASAIPCWDGIKDVCTAKPPRMPGDGPFDWSSWFFS